MLGFIFPPAMSKTKNKKPVNLFTDWTYTWKNYTLFGVGIAIIIAGYIIMAKGEVYSFQSLSLAPVLLFIGYLIVIPVSLLYKDKNTINQAS
tara:strand:+ start:76 stop:351 length:276 start_codon:yes stop_codon:yes gene_type:complete